MRPVTATALIWTVALFPAAASAAPIELTTWASGTDAISAAPGKHFVLDFTGQGFDNFAAADLHYVSFTFDSAPVTFTDLKVSFDGLAQPVTMAARDNHWAEYLLYDPAHKPVGLIGSYVQVAMDLALKDAFKDGKLSGNLWLQGASSTDPTAWTVMSEATFVVPEPAMLALLAVGGLALIRSRRSGAGAYPRNLGQDANH